MCKKRLLAVSTSVFSVLLFTAAVIVVFALSPLHPDNFSDETVVRKGAEFTVRLKGISEYDEDGFVLLTDGFYYTTEKMFVYTDENGFARTSRDAVSEAYIAGKKNSPTVLYDNYSFCGESYRDKKELEAFFEAPDIISDFDVHKLSEYLQNAIDYEKQFFGKATVSIYRGRCVITGIYIGEEKVLELK